MRFAAFLLFLPATLFAADCEEVYQATCRINGGATGVVFAQDETDLWIITAGHVMTYTNKKVKKSFVVHFYGAGTQSPAFRAEPSWHVLRKIPNTGDLGFLKVKKEKFLGKYPLPKPVPLAPPGTKVEENQKVISCGCPGGSWPTKWKGSVFKVSEDRLLFRPSPIPGRSGSGIFTDDGIVGIIIWYSKGSKKPYGTAISLEQIYKETKWEK